MDEKNLKKINEMNNEELNNALYDKMRAEQDKFRAWLESQTVSEILHHTYEYVTKEDILMALDDNPLPTAQARALLQSSSPLEDIYKDWTKKETDYMQDILDTIAVRANIFLQQEQEEFMQFANVPLYNQTYECAADCGDIDLFRKSHQANVACGQAIEEAIHNNYFGYSLDSVRAIEELLPRFGMERIKFVLANQVRYLDWDGRISAQNKEWAKTVPAPALERHSQDYIALSTHPGLLDMFASGVREFEQEQQKARPSVLAKLQQKTQQPKTPTPKKKPKEPER